MRVDDRLVVLLTVLAAACSEPCSEAANDAGRDALPGFDASAAENAMCPSPEHHPTRLPLSELPTGSYFAPDFDAVLAYDCTLSAPPQQMSFVVSRSTGCGLVTYELSHPQFRRRQIYDDPTGTLVGKYVSDDLPRDIGSCTDYAWVAGVEPRPACPSETIVYCEQP